MIVVLCAAATHLLPSRVILFCFLFLTASRFHVSYVLFFSFEQTARQARLSRCAAQWQRI
jgi:hypothetical protein